MMKKLLFTSTATLACAAASYGQISVGPTGVGPITFDGTTPPPAAEWATRTTVGGGSGDITRPTTNGRPCCPFGSRRWCCSIESYWADPGWADRYLPVAGCGARKRGG